MPQKLTPVLLLLVVLCSCETHRYIYSPAPANNPYFNGKNQSKLAAYLSGGDGERKGFDSSSRIKPKNRGFDLQAAYSITDHFAITADYFKRTERDIYIKTPENDVFSYFDSSVVNYNRKLWNMGVGYFTALDKRKTITFNFYGGIGFGKFSLIDNGADAAQAYTRNHNTDITKWYIQPSIHFMPERYFSIGLVTKFSFVHYGNISTTYTASEQNYYSLDWLPGRTLSFFEPTLNIQAGSARLDWLKIEGSFCSTPLDPATPSNRLKTRGWNASIGLVFDLTRLKKSKPADK